MNRAARWSKSLADSDNALWLIALASFLETIVVPIPIEVVLIPYMVAEQRRIWLIASVTTAGCLAGAVVGYGVGFFLFESVGWWFIETFQYRQAYRQFQGMFDTYGFWAILAIGVIPIPFQIAMVTAGIAEYPLSLFLLASGIARGIRYYGLAWLVLLFGNRALALWQRHAKTSGFALLGVFVGAFFAIRLLPKLFQ